MAVDGYLRTAAAELRQAVQTIKGDINGMRRYVETVESDSSKSVQDLQSKIDKKTSEAATATPLAQRQLLLAEVTRLKRQISQIRQDATKEKVARLSQIQNMENAATDLDARANDLENKPGIY